LLFGFGVGAITYKILYFVVKQIIFWSWLPGHLRRNIGRVGGGREWK
jgi:1-acyl-sn-glycerol-3-phosphate acyltransferase